MSAPIKLDAAVLLALPMDPAGNPAGATTLREYLAITLGKFAGMWSKIDKVEEPYGYAGGDWKWSAYHVFVKAGLCGGHLNDRLPDEPRETVGGLDRAAADELLDHAINGMRKAPSARDDLARAAVRAYRKYPALVRHLDDDLADALDRLSDAYGVTQ